MRSAFRVVGHRMAIAVCGGLAVVAGCNGTTPLSPSPLPSDDVELLPVPTLGISSIVAFGDSLTEGVTSSVIETMSVQLEPSNSYPAKLSSLLAQRYSGQVQVTNSGVGGEEAVEAVSRFQSELARLQPDVVLLMEGTNDLLPTSFGSGQEGAAAIETMVQDAKGRGVDPILATIPPQRTARDTEPMVNPYNDLIRQIAIRQNVPLVDVHQVISVGQCIGSASLELSCLGDDDLHPTVEGYGLIAEAFFEQLIDIYESSASGALTLTSPRQAPVIPGRPDMAGF